MSLRFSIEEAVKRGWIKPDAAAPQARGQSPSGPAPQDRLAQKLKAVGIDLSSKKRRVDREGNAQTLVIQEFDLAYPKFAGRLFHVANGGKRTRLERHLLVKQGVRKGVPDLVLPVPVTPYHGLYIEMKAEKPHASPVSDDQDDWITFLISQGYFATVCRGSHEAMDIIRHYLKDHGR